MFSYWVQPMLCRYMITYILHDVILFSLALLTLQILKMPKAKFKRKGIEPPLLLDEFAQNITRPLEKETASNIDTNQVLDSDSSIRTEISKNILDLPEEVICLIVAHISIQTIAALELTCKHLRQVLINARVWRKILLNKLEFEPGLRQFLPEGCRIRHGLTDDNLDHSG